MVTIQEHGRHREGTAVRALAGHTAHGLRGRCTDYAPFPNILYRSARNFARPAPRGPPQAPRSTGVHGLLCCGVPCAVWRAGEVHGPLIIFKNYIYICKFGGGGIQMPPSCVPKKLFESPCWPCISPETHAGQGSPPHGLCAPAVLAVHFLMPSRSVCHRSAASALLAGSGKSGFLAGLCRHRGQIPRCLPPFLHPPTFRVPALQPALGSFTQPN